MDDRDSRKPRPARGPAEPVQARLTPARSLAGEQPPPVPEADVHETAVEIDGREWTVRVLGRSGGSSTMSPAMLLLGFWDDPAAPAPALESLIVGEALAGLSTETLQAAYSVGRKPPDPDRRPPFFPEAAQSRRR